MNKADSPMFLPHTQVPELMAYVRDVLRDVQWFRASTLATAKQTLPALYNVVNSAHPFREGNGRTQRQFFNDLAGGAGLRIDWRAVPSHINDAASEAARSGDHTLMTAMFDRIVTEAPERAARRIGLGGFNGPGQVPGPSFTDQSPRPGVGLSRDPYEGRGR